MSGQTVKVTLPTNGGSGMTKVLDQITQVVRLADEAFERDGGSSRHWVRDHFLPLLSESGLRIIDPSKRPPEAAVEAMCEEMCGLHSTEPDSTWPQFAQAGAKAFLAALLEEEAK